MTSTFSITGYSSLLEDRLAGLYTRQVVKPVETNNRNLGDWLLALSRGEGYFRPESTIEVEAIQYHKSEPKPVLRKLRTAKGTEVETPYSDAEAFNKLSSMVANGFDNAFAKTLIAKRAQYGSLTHDQGVWCHRLVLEQEWKSQKPTSVESQTGEFAKIVTMLHAAKDRGLKYPSFKIMPSSREYEFKIAGQKSKTPGDIFVTNSNSGDYYGRITKDGGWVPSHKANSEVFSELQAIAVDPEKAVKAHGKLTGRCSFCSAKLTDPKSIERSYGPICARSYGLPY